jgi:hypothetical protein
MAGERVTGAAPQREALRWGAIGIAMIATMLALPLLLFALVSKIKLGFWIWSYYIPYEELWQAFGSADLRRIYEAPLLAVNVTSGFVIANMFTYRLGHTVVSILVAVLVVLLLRRQLAQGGCATRGAAISLGGATGGVFAVTAASASAALSGCCGSAMAGGMVALAGLGAVAGATTADIAAWVQPALAVALATWLWLPGQRQERAPSAAAPAIR